MNLCPKLGFMFSCYRGKNTEQLVTWHISRKYREIKENGGISSDKNLKLETKI